MNPAGRPLRTHTAGVGVRMRAWWSRHALTRALADGADPDTSAELTAVARELIGMRARYRLAAGLDRVVRAATEPRVPLHSMVPMNRRAIAAAQDELAALAERLRAARPVPVRAVALAAMLLSDGTGPLYHRAAARSAADVARTARLALDDPIR
jgi:hypothetical protein